MKNDKMNERMEQDSEVTSTDITENAKLRKAQARALSLWESVNQFTQENG